MAEELLPVSDYGYDPTGDEGAQHIQIHGGGALPDSYVIPATMLPPVGMQGTVQDPGAPGSCAAWASVYGLATSAAARAGGYDPATQDRQASPAFIYMEVTGISAPPCKGSALTPYFGILSRTGTPNLVSAPYYANCQELVNLYHDPSKPPAMDLAFKLGSTTVVQTSDAESIKRTLSANRPLAYGTRLYTDWTSYRGEPVPYVGNGKVAKSGKTGKDVGHCMMIIGYDDTMGAYRIQNSEGTQWGDSGYIWMAYATFEKLAQGKAFFYD
ncbi:C1 family peptidase [Paracidobacterium acidisoli]|uniref:Peptidase C1A papain C-terminal domain-containing protein n=1 Tax=Paracidobacterium acidisoli TaxID=2303751 RepID=A0A372ILU1_9BACT|nr:C1 family peptidase [Paracidobacterium acidisoli]MBT9332462.1 C1 family peptidase [Paracidobacterium acidisoli]